MRHSVVAPVLQSIAIYLTVGNLPIEWKRSYSLTTATTRPSWWAPTVAPGSRSGAAPTGHPPIGDRPAPAARVLAAVSQHRASRSGRCSETRVLLKARCKNGNPRCRQREIGARGTPTFCASWRWNHGGRL